MDKRAEFSELTRIILVLIFALVMFFAIQAWVTFIMSQSSDNLCTQSILKSGIAGVPEFKCEPKRITLSREDIEQDAGGRLDAEGLDDAVKKAVADEMYYCWKMTEKGNVNPYWESLESPKKSVLFGTRDFFFICEIVTFKDIPDFNGLLFWIALNKPKTYDKPYFDLFYGRNPSEEEIKEFEAGQDSYDATRVYVIAWRATMYDFSSDFDQGIVLVPYEELVQDSYKPYIGSGFSSEILKDKNGAYFPVVMN